MKRKEAMSVIERIDEVRASWNVLDHPFYLRWEQGELTREELAFYAGEYRHAVVALADAAHSAGDPEHAEEERAHVALWDDFAASLGASLDRPPRPETRACVAAMAVDDAVEARAVLYAVESGQPAVSRTKLAGLVDHYGFTPDAAGTAYFELHAERDLEHAARSAEILAELPADDTDRLVVAASAALQANWRLLDGVDAAR
jgi:pyrroloquinoline-quinone synthase